MHFNSLQFAIFFPVVTAIYFISPNRLRWLWLLLASCYFYMQFVPHYILILFSVIFVDYLAGIFLEDSTGRWRRFLLFLSISANLGTLAIFKYFNFFIENVNLVTSGLSPEFVVSTLNFVLPIGLSFHVLQSLSYTIEVYYGRQRAERNLGIYALYVLFYPQLVAGPIERPQNLLPQLHISSSFDWPRVRSGLQLMTTGFFKKMVIADRLAVFVNPVYSSPSDYPGLTLLLACYFFSFQIFCDFSGYTDIARGASRVMGFELMQNFKAPYVANSVSEFWSRWHISLSTWFRDYVYIPLGGNRFGRVRWCLNLLVVFLLSGLWHGANWTFLAWGFLHGLYLILALMLKDYWAGVLRFLPKKLRAPICVFFVFHLVTLAWIFFRANSISQALEIVKRMFDASLFLNGKSFLPYGCTLIDLLLAVTCISILLHLQWRTECGRRDIWSLVNGFPLWLRSVYYYAILLLFISLAWIWGTYSTHQFIYFQF